MHAYYYDDNDGSDPKEPHEKNPLTIVTPEELAHAGVSYLRIEGEDFLDKIEKISEERRYKNLSKEALGDMYDNKMKIFFEEHLHEDEEIRYVLDGSGYFDVRDLQDKWIRIAVTKGDLIILPAGIYHRFTTDTNDYIKAMRLFKEEPKWTPINRPADDNNFRKDYLKSIQNFGSYK
nr:13634_t:CDS:2 [Entrophospora candida]CAG8629742.1 11047_t:CDS:2 [Entrophospora candida]